MVELSRSKTVNAIKWDGENEAEISALVVDEDGNPLTGVEQTPDQVKLYVADKPSPDDANYRQLEVPAGHYVVVDADLPGRVFVHSPEEIESEFGYVEPVAEVTEPVVEDTAPVNDEPPVDPEAPQE
jgi:hypothetical protein